MKKIAKVKNKELKKHYKKMMKDTIIRNNLENSLKETINPNEVVLGYNYSRQPFSKGDVHNVLLVHPTEQRIYRMVFDPNQDIEVIHMIDTQDEYKVFSLEKDDKKDCRINIIKMRKFLAQIIIDEIKGKK